MDAEEAQRLRREWFGKPCCHLRIEKEEIQGREMNEYVCLTCGSEFGSRKVWQKILQKRKDLIEERNCYLLIKEGDRLRV